MFKFDAEYETNEEKYGAIKTELLGDDSGIKKIFHKNLTSTFSIDH